MWVLYHDSYFDLLSPQDRYGIRWPERTRNKRCLNRYLLGPLVRCALLIAVICLYLSPLLLYPRTGHLRSWVLHFGTILLLHSGVWCYREYHTLTKWYRELHVCYILNEMRVTGPKYLKPTAIHVHVRSLTSRFLTLQNGLHLPRDNVFNYKLYRREQCPYRLIG